MLTFGRPLLLLTVALLSLVSCQERDLDCQCTEDRNRSISVELNCVRDTDSILELSCDRAEVPVIPDGYSLIAGYGVYKLYRTVMIWDSASSFCQLEGGRLAIPQDNVSFAGLIALLQAAPGVEMAYLGITDAAETGVYLGVDGNAAPYLSWRTGEPDNAVDEDGVLEHCVEFNEQGMNDIHCHDQAAFVCEVPGDVDDYTWVEGASRFIKVHTEELAYEDAQAACEAEGGTLAVLETYDRAIAVLDVLPEDLENAWVGFSDVDEEGTFVTATGRKLEDMQYLNWDKDQPNNGDGGEEEDCITLSYLGYYDDISCSTTTAFICQITSV